MYGCQWKWSLRFTDDVTPDTNSRMNSSVSQAMSSAHIQPWRESVPGTEKNWRHFLKRSGSVSRVGTQHLLKSVKEYKKPHAGRGKHSLPTGCPWEFFRESAALTNIQTKQPCFTLHLIFLLTLCSHLLHTCNIDELWAVSLSEAGREEKEKN